MTPALQVVIKCSGGLSETVLRPASHDDPSVSGFVRDPQERDEVGPKRNRALALCLRTNGVSTSWARAAAVAIEPHNAGIAGQEVARLRRPVASRLRLSVVRRDIPQTVASTCASRASRALARAEIFGAVVQRNRKLRINVSAAPTR